MIKLYYNPRCSKSKEALSLLQERLPISAFQVREYLKKPLDVAELKALQALLGVSVREMLRVGEQAYWELDLGAETKTDDELLAAIAARPALLQRPIVTNGDRALIARPPELLLQLLP
ncbi:arsenate reductase (glutaredoxin) [Paucibacter sp. R3-3]|uniref:Arsenate reductase n=1 Tax=Roseateles agri TaxID=3098619 RepID=A0ABU5DBT2_9BURK|nr:arsenate reductase (glutaredoxin) [Paucibacter sp. R3-3]MDY0743734.1 arsenate reductase (glutaredoxin) [Paucibacter sp. R3-3]